jgi:hypothetical protein
LKKLWKNHQKGRAAKILPKKQVVLKTLAALFLTATILVAGSFVSTARAERLESDSYIIQFGNFNVTSGAKDSASFNLTDTVGQVASGPYGAYGSSTYFIGAGFQYIYQIQDFRFMISKLAIDLGLLTPGSHNTDSHTLTITTRGAGGYTIYAYELHPLRQRLGSAEIPDTACDAGTCTISVAQVWQTQSVPGFGYNMSGQDIPADFLGSTYFRPFADFSINDPMQIVMSSPNIATSRQATVTYKAGISGSQAAGQYETGVVYIAVPGY